MRQLDFTDLTDVWQILFCQLNLIVNIIVNIGFLKLASRNNFLTWIFIKSVSLKQRIPATYFRNVRDIHLKTASVKAYFVNLHQLLLPLRQASAFLGMSLFVSLAANLPSNALCITMTLILPMDPATRLLIISLAVFQLISYGGTIYLAASVNREVHGPSMALLSAHIRNQRINNRNDFQTRLFQSQERNDQKEGKIRFFLRAERHFEQFVANSKRRYLNQYGLTFGTFGCITLLSAAKVRGFHFSFL